MTATQTHSRQDEKDARGIRDFYDKVSNTRVRWRAKRIALKTRGHWFSTPRWFRILLRVALRRGVRACAAARLLPAVSSFSYLIPLEISPPAEKASGKAKIKKKRKKTKWQVLPLTRARVTYMAARHACRRLWFSSFFFYPRVTRGFPICWLFFARFFFPLRRNSSLAVPAESFIRVGSNERV